MPVFIPGVELARDFYHEVVAPILGDLPHSAARLGWGSDVLGFDTERSTDHGWGPRVQVFVDPESVQVARETIDDAIPDEFQGWPTRFGWDEVPVSHHVEIDALDHWLRGRLGFDSVADITTRDWLATPQQILLEVTGGAVFHDVPGEASLVTRILSTVGLKSNPMRFPTSADGAVSNAGPSATAIAVHGFTR